MIFSPFVSAKCGTKIPVQILPMTAEDALVTNGIPRWQSDWTSEYVAQKHLGKYALKSLEGEIIALAAYNIQGNSVAVHIAYMESQPESNPTITQEKSSRKYRGIGRVLVAYGIKLSIDNNLRGDVTLDAKTTELAFHYEKDFGALPLPRYEGMAPRYLICDEAAKQIFFDYLD